MTKHILKAVVLSIMATALSVGTFRAPAQTNTTPPAAKEKKKATGFPFRGKVASIDNTAKTITVGERTFQITSKTRVTRDGKPATLEDGKVGEPVTGYVKKSEDGKLNATTVHFGAKASSKPKEKAEKEGDNE